MTHVAPTLFPGAAPPLTQTAWAPPRPGTGCAAHASAVQPVMEVMIAGAQRGTVKDSVSQNVSALRRMPGFTVIAQQMGTPNVHPQQTEGLAWANPVPVS